MAQCRHSNIPVVNHFWSWERVILALILLLAAWARLSDPDLGWFMPDQARDAVEATKIASGQNLPLVGPVVREVYGALGPLYYYLLAIPFWFSRDPIMAVSFIGFLNFATVYLTYRIGKTFFDGRVGLVAAGLYAAFPMAVMSAKTLWNPGFMPVFVSLFYYALLHFLVRHSPWGLVVALVALACALQIHLSAVGLVPVLLLGCLLCRPPVSPRHLALGLLLFLGLYTPFLVFEALHGFENLRQLAGFGQAYRTTSAGIVGLWLSWKALLAPFLIPEEMLLPSSGLFQAFFGMGQRAELMLFLGGLVYLVYRLIAGQREPQRWRAHTVLLLWMLIPVLTVASLRVSWFPWYYLDGLYPAQFLVVGIVLSDLALPTRWMGWCSKTAVALVQGLGGVLVVLIVLSQVLYLVSLRASILSTGAIRFTPNMILGIDESLHSLLMEGGLETMPMRYKRALTEGMLNEFRVNQEVFESQIHGPAFEDLREDKGFFLHLRAAALGDQKILDPEWHYLMVRQDQFQEDLGQGQAIAVGPFRLLAYRPLIQTSSWMYTVTPQPGWRAAAFDDSLWQPIRLPARWPSDLLTHTIPRLRAWQAAALYFRGWVDPPAPGTRLHIIVGLKEGFSGSLPLASLHVDGKPVEASRTLIHYTSLGRNLALVFDVSRFVKSEPALLALHVSGTTSSFDLDIYELLADEMPLRR